MKKYLIGLAIVGAFGCQPAPQTPSAPQSATTPAPLSSRTADTETTLTGALQADVQLDRESYLPGDQIHVTVIAVGLTDTAWVGVVPSDIPHGSEEENDAHDLGYLRVGEEPIVLLAPAEPGDYDVRLNDSDDAGKEVASRSFKVTVDPAPVEEPKLLWQPPQAVVAESSISVEFEAPLSFPEDAWIGIVPSSTAHGEEAVNDSANLGYQHLNKRSRGKVTLTAPTEPGSYDVRMFDTDSDGKEVASVTFEVVAKP